MTDSLKLAEMQRTSIEFERQRHLANWFIKSGPHMATPPSLNLNGNANGGGNCSNNNKAQKSGGAGGKNGTIAPTNPLFFIVAGQKPPPPAPQQMGGGGGGSIGLSRSQIFTSQTNLPLQIVTTSAQEGHKPKLRRFNSHDTSANMFSVADFENARLARRNEIEMKQRQQQRLKMNSLSSGGDCSTGDSKGSKYSNESQMQPQLLPADEFLDRYSLPRVVRISYKPKFSHETLQSSSSNGSSSTSSSTSITPKGSDSSKQNGELFVLYRHLRQRKIYHGFNTKSGSGSRKKGVMIPQEFPGYFSLLNDKGVPTATMYTTLVQLVRECVYKFISVDNLPAFTESQSTESFPPRPHYVKSTARGGQIFRLLAVFEDGKQDNGNSASKNANSSGREKEKGRYAQLLNENRQILYVSLTAKGKFYEIESGVPQILQKTLVHDDTQKKLNPDCVHRISNLITSDIEFPTNIKFISGPTGTSNLIPENLTLTRISTENVLIACPIEDVEARSPLHLRKLPVTSEMMLIKCFLGFENEQRMFSNQNVQNILKFCQINCDNFMKLIEFETINRTERTASRSKVDGLKILKPLNLPKLLRREKSTIAHEKEDSIIFLSKNDLANLESKDDAQQNNSGELARISDKMKVFQPTKKKWFRKSDKHSSLASLDIEAQAKRMSMERYHDMSKLLQERFGDALNESSNGDRPTSEIGRFGIKSRSKMQKSLSLQDVDFLDKPDLVPVNFTDDCLSGGSHDNMNHYNEDGVNSLRNFGSGQQIYSQIHQQPVAQTQQHINSQSGQDRNQNQAQVQSSSQSQTSQSQSQSQSQTLTQTQSQSMLQSQQQQSQGNHQQSFISEKMYSEFHVKTRQYSKSSSSLHQLLHFAVPQRMNVCEMKKNLSKTNHNSNSNNNNINGLMKRSDIDMSNSRNSNSIEDYIDDDISSIGGGGSGTPLAMMMMMDQKTNNCTIIDDLPYSSVRDSLISDDHHGKDNENNHGGAKAISYINLEDDEAKENIYAEICHDGGAISRVQINVISEPISSSSNNYNNYHHHHHHHPVPVSSISISGNSTTTQFPASRAAIYSASPVSVSQTQYNTNESRNFPTASQLHVTGASTDNIYNTIK